jgi:hypothetical protein
VSRACHLPILRLRLLIMGVALCGAVLASSYPAWATTTSSHASRVASRHPARKQGADKKPACGAVRHRRHPKAIRSCAFSKSKHGTSTHREPSLSSSATTVGTEGSGVQASDGMLVGGSPPLAETSPVTEPPAPAEPGTAESPAPFRFFSPTSFWNEALPSDAPLDPSSTAVVQAFDEEVAAEESDGGPNIDTARWSVPIYTVPADEPTVRVKLLNASKPLQAAWNAVPLPSDAQPAAGTDKHLVVWQPSTDRLWEFWHLEHTAAGWQAPWGGAMQNVSSNPGAYGPGAWPGADTGWGGSASSLSLAGGLITLEDLEMGEINHALAMGIPNVRAGVYASPAERDDGVSTNPLSLPEGAHLRLDPNLNLTALHLPPFTLMLAEAAQRYGILVRSRAANIVLYAQDPTPTGTEPYTGPGGYFEGKYPDQLLASFPWSHLQLLKMSLHNYP